MDENMDARSEAGSNPFAWSVPLGVDDEDSQFLDTPQVNTVEEELIPREVIAEALGATRFQAELSRPLSIGTLRGKPAYLLRTRFSFGRVTTNWLTRIQAADIKLVFEDAPAPGIKGEQHPAVAEFYPEEFEGRITSALRTDNAEAALNVSYLGTGGSLTLGQSTTREVEGKVVVHGIRGGGRHRNAITWSIEEDRVARGGIPRTVELPLILTTESKGRFSARVTVKAHYGFWRGALARGVPVLGKNDSPLYFDPEALLKAVEGRTQSPDGRLIAETVGSMDGLSLATYSTFKSA